MEQQEMLNDMISKLKDKVEGVSNSNAADDLAKDVKRIADAMETLSSIWYKKINMEIEHRKKTDAINSQHLDWLRKMREAQTKLPDPLKPPKTAKQDGKETKTN